MRFGSRLFVTPILLVTAASAQDQGQKPRLTFDVAVIHPSKPGSTVGSIKSALDGTGYTVQNVPVKLIMSAIYRIPLGQVVGGPDWFPTAQFDIEAKADHAHVLGDLNTMFKNLLADRFGLKFHTEMKPGPVYELVIDNSGLKMKADTSEGSPKTPIMPSGMGQFVGTRVPTEYLCRFLGQQLRRDPRPVIDKTGLTQTYDFTLEFMPDLPPGVTKDDLEPELRNRPVLPDALQKQLGLKLVPAMGLVPNYVIDHVEKPSAN
jgi:uncharacterized protein (TIGR03435 family)